MKTLEQKPELQGKIPLDVMEKLGTALKSLETALETADPEIRQHLRESHRLLITYPETAHLLDDEEINVLLDVAQKQMTVQVVSDTAKSKKASKTKPSVDDL